LETRKVRYEEMLPHEIVEARTAKPAAFLPIGGVEWHGEHNCVGLDTIKIHALAMKCAEEGGGLVFPPLFYCEPREHYLMEANHDEEGKIAGKMGLPPENFQSGLLGENATEWNFQYTKVIVRIMKQIFTLGFKVISVCPGHYPLIFHAEAACRLFNLEFRGLATSWAFKGYELIKDKVPEAGDHAGAWETSLMMYLRPDLVDISRLPEDPASELIGVGGRDPRIHASKEFGEKGVRLISEVVNGRIAELLDPLK